MSLTGGHLWAPACERRGAPEALRLSESRYRPLDRPEFCRPEQEQTSALVTSRQPRPIQVHSGSSAGARLTWRSAARRGQVEHETGN